MKIKLNYHLMPWEIDYALLAFTKLKRSSYFISKEHEIHLHVVLNLSSNLISWDLTHLSKAFFIRKFNCLRPLLNWASSVKFEIYEGDQLYGHLDMQKLWKDDDVDAFMNICPDMYFHEYLLPNMIEMASSIEDDYFILTPQIYKMWDSTWDCITAEKYMSVPYDQWDKNDIFDIEYDNALTANDLYCKQIDVFKFAGWFDLYSAKLIHDVLPVPESWSGYGPWDFYSMLLLTEIKKNRMLDVNQYVIVNSVIAEYSRGPLKFGKGFDTIAFAHKHDIFSYVNKQREQIESTFSTVIPNQLKNIQNLIKGTKI